MIALFYFFGLAALTACGYFGYSAITMDVTVDTGDMIVANTQLMQAQALQMHLAIGLMIAGAVLISTGAIIERMTAGETTPPSA